MISSPVRSDELPDHDGLCHLRGEWSTGKQLETRLYPSEITAGKLGRLFNVNSESVYLVARSTKRAVLPDDFDGTFKGLTPGDYDLVNGEPSSMRAASTGGSSQQTAF